MSEPRAHRPALTPKQAADELRREVRSGRLAADAVDAVLAAAGQRRSRRPSAPAGRTPPALAVLPLLAPRAPPPKASPRVGITAQAAETNLRRLCPRSG